MSVIRIKRTHILWSLSDNLLMMGAVTMVIVTGGPSSSPMSIRLMITRVIAAMFGVWEKYNTRDKIKFLRCAICPLLYKYKCCQGQTFYNLHFIETQIISNDFHFYSTHSLNQSPELNDQRRVPKPKLLNWEVGRPIP